MHELYHLVRETYRRYLMYDPMNQEQEPIAGASLNPVARLRKIRDSTEQDHACFAQRERYWSLGRLFAFAGAVAGWVLWRDLEFLGLAAAGGMLLVFAHCVRRHGFAKARRELAGRMVLMADEAILRCTDWLVAIRCGDRPEAAASGAGVGSVLEEGRAWPLTGQECDDLDLFARPIGLFGLLNRTSTMLGARRLCGLLEHPLLDSEQIRRRQRTVRWLDEHLAARIRVMGAAANLRNRDAMLDRLVVAIRECAALPHPVLVTLMRLWALPSTLIALWTIVGMSRGEVRLGYPLALLLLLNGVLYSRMRKALNGCLSAWRDITPAVRGYDHVAHVAEAVLPHEGELDQIRVHLHAVARPAVLPALCRRVGWSECGGMLHALCNLVFFFDVHVAKMILSNVLPNRGALMSGLAAVADLEAQCSLACFAFESQAGGGTCYPALSGDQCIRIADGRHPQIPPCEAIGNDVEVSSDARLWVITGPNMAGKSTLLRMVGVNCLLGQLGTAVPAGEMTLTPIRLITDLRVRDNLAKHESYFLAEVRQLLRMVEPEQDAAPILGLIDEPFRGTNSDEQVAAGLAVFEHLLGMPHFFLIATHEQRLAQLAEVQEGARNYHFHEELREQGMVFDYRLRPGPALARNALDVLAREGFPSEVVANARRRLRQDRA